MLYPSPEDRFRSPDQSNSNRCYSHTVLSADEYLALWRREVDFEEDVRSLIRLLRPHRQELLKGWTEHSTRGEHFRVTVAWDPILDAAAKQSPLEIPNLTDVFEAVLIGSAKNQDELEPKAEFELYASVVRELDARLRDLRSRYDVRDEA
jgi:hypothetical protein